MKKRIKLYVAYDGTSYSGWQYQPNANTIEGVLNEKLSELLGEEITVIGASRTDAGVHSLGNIAVFDTSSRIPAEKISYAINPYLPDDIVVNFSCEVAPDYHPRRVNSQKTYAYRILNASFPQPLMRNDSLFLHGKLDVDAMKEAAQFFKGEHDFASFCAANSSAETTVRTIFDIDVLTDVDYLASIGKRFELGKNQDPEVSTDSPVLITILVRGSGFLYNMVRIIAGTLVEVGRGRVRPDEISSIIEAKDRSAAGPTAPACGLTHVCTVEES